MHFVSQVGNAVIRIQSLLLNVPWSVFSINIVSSIIRAHLPIILIDELVTKGQGSVEPATESSVKG